MDACFRMENRLRAKSKHKQYPFLADGLGCFVPRESYFSHLMNYVKEDDVSEHLLLCPTINLLSRLVAVSPSRR